jgi:hypothetical protein
MARIKYNSASGNIHIILTVGTFINIYLRMHNIILLHQESDEGTLLQLLRRNEETGTRETSMVAATRLSL